MATTTHAFRVEPPGEVDRLAEEGRDLAEQGDWHAAIAKLREALAAAKPEYTRAPLMVDIARLMYYTGADLPGAVALIDEALPVLVKTNHPRFAERAVQLRTRIQGAPDPMTTHGFTWVKRILSEQYGDGLHHG